MVAKDDKDGQIALLRDALEKIHNEAKLINSSNWEEIESCRKIEHIAETAIFDVTF